MKERIKKAFTILLMVDAGWVALGQIEGWNMWPWVCAYWVILTIKNLADWMNGREK